MLITVYHNDRCRILEYRSNGLLHSVSSPTVAALFSTGQPKTLEYWTAGQHIRDISFYYWGIPLTITQYIKSEMSGITMFVLDDTSSRIVRIIR